ncbi:MAG: hypothetical protein KKE11_04100 [Gammaproteobacteria bacterium]|nr:hypothetical protein [Gammaproteobacteria bacterium]
MNITELNQEEVSFVTGGVVGDLIRFGGVATASFLTIAVGDAIMGHMSISKDGGIGRRALATAGVFARDHLIAKHNLVKLGLLFTGMCVLGFAGAVVGAFIEKSRDDEE